VKDKIRRSDGLIAFTTRRDQLANGKWTTHRWVTDELSVAIDAELPVVEVRETEVDLQGGIAGDRQRIDYDEAKRDQCVVELATTLGRWWRGSARRLRLLPADFVNEVRPLLRQPGFRCTSEVLEGNRNRGKFESELLPITGGLFATVKSLPRAALVRIRIEAGGKAWTSDFESTDSLSIHLKPE
jgi:hypothetical protein